MIEHENDYFNWVLGTCFGPTPFADYANEFRGLPRLRSFIKEPLPDIRISWVYTGGYGTGGSLQIKAHPGLRQPLIWAVASNAEKRGVGLLVEEPIAHVLPHPLQKDVLTNALSKRLAPGFREKRNAFFKSLGLDPNLPTLGYVGRIMPRKGVARSIELLAGQKYKTQLVAGGIVVDEQGVKSTGNCEVARLPFLEREQYAEFLTFVDAVVALSTRGDEDYGLLPREALAVGTPVVITSWGGFRDIVLPPGLDRTMIAWLPVELGEDRQPSARIRDFQAEEFIGRCRALPDETRRQCSRAMLDCVSKDILSGLDEVRRTSEKLVTQLARGELQYEPVRFTRFSYELVLVAASNNYYNPDQHYPVEKQMKLMAGS